MAKVQLNDVAITLTNSQARSLTKYLVEYTQTSDFKITPTRWSYNPDSSKIIFLSEDKASELLEDWDLESIVDGEIISAIRLESGKVLKSIKKDGSGTSKKATEDIHKNESRASANEVTELSGFYDKKMREKQTSALFVVKNPVKTDIHNVTYVRADKYGSPYYMAKILINNYEKGTSAVDMINSFGNGIDSLPERLEMAHEHSNTEFTDEYGNADGVDDVVLRGTHKEVDYIYYFDGNTWSYTFTAGISKKEQLRRLLDRDLELSDGNKTHPRDMEEKLSEAIAKKRLDESDEISKEAMEQFEDIAKTHLGIDTLKTQNSDRLDFHDVAVWNIVKALKLAYQAGVFAGMKSNSKKK